ncbi:MarR family winged helix-turn-helix transcriptional regulator [Xylella taiwanensis]|nr:MarR family winged helix-turn-helix transcriptional regulator [Xylella taiwanensis]MCD8456214.1 MarR family winged helix-turn-helix transcriptional regulator [Xylella taiwanensis]MCD8458622.1 MarR family winged helix-turn-helix transcriptional regulator [Xylella taiwanensis]MCD8460757.1 MarR family winged helix-turn-helix transcriptional regulator [Xylella taiwanensis]MCD8463184.1 MarR family winged helix-turn-helix transcriptional regulator [Xylella taiwanensis]UFN40958.1 MarR family winge
MKRTAAGEALSDLLLDLFRLNSRANLAGDRLLAPLGLTSARWQLLGTIKCCSDRPQPVAWLARDTAANRQNVQRIVNDLERDGLVAFKPNPHHRRAHLIVLTEKGQQAWETAMKLQVPWVNDLADGLRLEDIKTMRALIITLRGKLEKDAAVEDEE